MRKLKSKSRRLLKALPIMLACMGLIGSTAAAESVKPSETINNRVTVDEESYSINGESTAHEGELDAVYGGGDEETAGDVSYNQTTINGGRIGSAIGGASTTGDVTNNSITITDGEIENVTGGIGLVNQSLGNSTGNVTGNRIVIRGGTISFVSGGEIAYTYTVEDGNALTNLTLMLGKGDVSDNTIEIRGGTITGGVTGGAAMSGTSHENRIMISGGSLEGQIIGGRSQAGAVQNNTIEISGGEINGSLIGGLSNTGAVNDNVIVISGMPDLTDAYLIGAVTSASADGNTLTIRTTGLTAKNISDFDNLNFELDENVRAGATVITLTDESGTDLGDTKISMNANGRSRLTTNDQLNLIVNQNGIRALDSSSDVDEGSGSSGGLNYDDVMYRGTEKYELGMNLSEDGTALVATVGEYIPEYVPILPMEPPAVEIRPEKDGEFADTQVEDVEHVQEQHGYEIFMNTGGGHLKTKTGNGSYIKSNMGSIDLGIARHFQRNSSILSFAPVFEYGFGDYDAYLPRGEHGYGHQKYMAGGAIIRSFNNSGFYYEGSLRGGQSKTTYSTNDFERKGQKTYVHYKADAPILLGHLRVGNQWRLGRDNLLDVYGYYAYARQGSASTTLNLGDRYNFSSTDSGRFRTGYRLTSRLSPISQLYTGLAFQYDLNSDATSKVNGHEKLTLGKDGASGMLEVGWLIRPLRENPWAIDIHATGWIGLQEGVTAMAKLKKVF